MAASVFCVPCELKTPNLAVFFQYPQLSTSHDSKFGNIQEETYETYSVAVHKHGDVTIM